MVADQKAIDPRSYEQTFGEAGGGFFNEDDFLSEDTVRMYETLAENLFRSGLIDGEDYTLWNQCLNWVRHTIIRLAYERAKLPPQATTETRLQDVMDYVQGLETSREFSQAMSIEDRIRVVAARPMNTQRLRQDADIPTRSKIFVVRMAELFTTYAKYAEVNDAKAFWKVMMDFDHYSLLEKAFLYGVPALGPVAWQLLRQLSGDQRAMMNRVRDQVRFRYNERCDTRGSYFHRDPVWCRENPRVEEYVVGEMSSDMGGRSIQDDMAWWSEIIDEVRDRDQGRDNSARTLIMGRAKIAASVRRWILQKFFVTYAPRFIATHPVIAMLGVGAGLSQGFLFLALTQMRKRAAKVWVSRTFSSNARIQELRTTFDTDMRDIEGNMRAQGWVFERFSQREYDEWWQALRNFSNEFVRVFDAKFQRLEHRNAPVAYAVWFDKQVSTWRALVHKEVDAYTVDSGVNHDFGNAPARARPQGPAAPYRPPLDIAPAVNASAAGGSGLVGAVIDAHRARLVQQRLERLALDA